MTDISRESYARIMREIEDMEKQVEKLKKEGMSSDLEKAREKLWDLQHELRKISDGCGTPHH